MRTERKRGFRRSSAGRSAPDRNAESCEEGALRELKEETGYISDNWMHLLTTPANATLSNSRVHIYAARGCQKVSGQDLDDSEFLGVELVSEKELVHRIFEGDFKQSLHVLAYYLFKEKNTLN